MKKVCFLTMGNIELAPYIEIYMKYVEGACHIIFWDREGRGQRSDGNYYYRYNKQIKDTDKVQKAIGYAGYKRFARRVLLENKFDLVICLQTCVALLLSDVLMSKYAGKFIVDIRDYSDEKIGLVYKREKRLFARAKKCVISSEGYKEFLPAGEYLIAHNLRQLPKDEVESIRNRETKRTRLHIAYIGHCAYQEQYKKLLLNLKNDERFIVSFFGTRAEELEEFCRNNDIKNVRISGTFDAKDILQLYKDVDFVNNLYGNHTPVLDYALSNKLYFATELRIPILTCPDTYMAKVALHYGVGIAVNADDFNLGDCLYDYYMKLDWKKMSDGCQRFLDRAYKEQACFESYIRSVISNEGDNNENIICD